MQVIVKAAAQAKSECDAACVCTQKPLWLRSECCWPHHITSNMFLAGFLQRYSVVSFFSKYVLACTVN
jgi:hypothetical protein